MAKPMQFGLIAEEVAEVFPELAVYNDDGEPETVKYHLLSSLLLNEFLKLFGRHETLNDEHETLKAEKDAEVAETWDRFINNGDETVTDTCLVTYFGSY